MPAQPGKMILLSEVTAQRMPALPGRMILLCEVTAQRIPALPGRMILLCAILQLILCILIEMMSQWLDAAVQILHFAAKI